MMESESKYNRRAMLAGAGVVAAATMLPARLLRAADGLRFAHDPFTLGVASGYPVSDGVVLWTRLAPRPQEPGGGLPATSVVPVTWELAGDPAMRKVVRTGVEYATAEWAHSVHAEPSGLEPEREYWYRFTAGGRRSAIGRTRTAPRQDAANARMRIAVAACQQYEHGYFVGYRHMLEDQLDLILHVGDYIYETSWGENSIRSHNTPEAMTLEDYRARYALYRGERELQAAHAHCPWMVTWDDHEVENDYAGDVSEEDDTHDWFLARRAAAYRAFYEHMPLPRRAVPHGAHLRLFAQRSFGGLANVITLDTRQYRSPRACTALGQRRSTWANCAQLHAGERTKLGAVQEGWLAERIGASSARWNLFASGTIMAYVDGQAGPGETFPTDGWNGYPAARARFISALAERRVKNPIVLSGDIHSFLVARHHRVAADGNTPIVASEFVSSSLTSQGLPQKRIDEYRAANPNLLFASSERRGYLRLDLTKERLQVDMIASESVVQRDARSSVLTSFVVEDGKPGPTEAR
jgi:alkaline phosphatase D